MLNWIATWSGCDIFANIKTTWTYCYYITSQIVIDPSVWNQNVREVTWTDIEDGSMTGSDRWFEYTTTGLQNYRWILYN